MPNGSTLGGFTCKDKTFNSSRDLHFSVLNAPQRGYQPKGLWRPLLQCSQCPTVGKTNQKNSGDLHFSVLNAPQWGIWTKRALGTITLVSSIPHSGGYQPNGLWGPSLWCPQCPTVEDTNQKDWGPSLWCPQCPTVGDTDQKDSGDHYFGVLNAPQWGIPTQKGLWGPSLRCPQCPTVGNANKKGSQ